MASALVSLDTPATLAAAPMPGRTRAYGEDERRPNATAIDKVINYIIDEPINKDKP
ncbi:hypothetical protein GCM10007853_01790 [Algimonas ampicilliniresistens]|uniref:Uncharacterized protein n=1 Tax=Algimonas ampicilliniresistens TaxID=1298735 RepID=A0ABQ5V4I9_9PROT|nr:hypothetical protein GCM10007853_01790 [Algimonas ampicilliniresistens]